MYDYKTYILKNYYGEDYELIPIAYSYTKDNTLAMLDAQESSYLTIRVSLHLRVNLF